MKNKHEETVLAWFKNPDRFLFIESGIHPHCFMLSNLFWVEIQKKFDRINIVNLNNLLCKHGRDDGEMYSPDSSLLKGITIINVERKIYLQSQDLGPLDSLITDLEAHMTPTIFNSQLSLEEIKKDCISREEIQDKINRQRILSRISATRNFFIHLDNPEEGNE
jgi:hypothetical protein